ncbi:uncharacterized protein L201_003132 [Kwoniella dendrophila CBS 6074]|uniref:Uncharacterized protein n=1 Tax=Kwoniella dendrophila CBS 6074 TaxID=1295534 RepID=A0AAX4JUJ8_9TREE
MSEIASTGPYRFPSELLKGVVLDLQTSTDDALSEWEERNDALVKNASMDDIKKRLNDGHETRAINALNDEASTECTSIVIEASVEASNDTSNKWDITYFYYFFDREDNQTGSLTQTENVADFTEILSPEEFWARSVKQVELDIKERNAFNALKDASINMLKTVNSVYFDERKPDEQKMFDTLVNKLRRSYNTIALRSGCLAESVSSERKPKFEATFEEPLVIKSGSEIDSIRLTGSYLGKAYQSRNDYDELLDLKEVPFDIEVTKGELASYRPQYHNNWFEHTRRSHNW